MNKAVSILKIVFWALIIVIAISLLLGITTGRFIGRMSAYGGQEMNSGDWKVLMDEAYPAEGITSISIDGRSEDIRILPSSDGQFHVYEAYRRVGLVGSDPSAADVETRGGTFYVSRRDRWGAFVAFGWNEHIMDIYIPDSHWESFNAGLSSGKLSANGIATVSMNLHCSSGSITAENVKVDDHLELGISSGRITVKNTSSKTGNIEVSSGEIKLDNYTTYSLSTRTTSGSIHGERVNAGTLTTKTSSGTVNIEGSFSDVSSRATSGSITLRSQTTPEKLSVDISSGTVKCYLPHDSIFDINYRISSGTVQSDWHSIGNNKSGQTSGNGSGIPMYNVEITSGTAKFLKD